MGFIPKEATAEWVVQYWDNNACILRTKIFGKFEKAKNWATNSMNDLSIDNAIVMRVHYALYKETKVVVVDNKVPDLTEKAVHEEARMCSTCAYTDLLACEIPCRTCWVCDEQNNGNGKHLNWEPRRD